MITRIISGVCLCRGVTNGMYLMNCGRDGNRGFRFREVLGRVGFTLFLMIGIFGFLSGQNLEGIRIYINPGHGGFDSDDRNVPIPPFALGDTAGFWESKSNLDKALFLREMLELAGAGVIMSRVQNRSVDDRPLSAIAEEANVNQVDFMISVHSNAFNSITNYVLMLFHGWDNRPILQPSMDLAELFFDNLFSNQTSRWSYQGRQVRGDKSFADQSWDGYGVLRPLTVPGLISEGSFHDYFPETCRLMNREYRKLEAWHLFRAFCQYYGGNPGNKGVIAGTVKDSYRKVTDYYWIPGSGDQWLPVNGARVTLQPGNKEYITDDLNNGFYLFDDLAPGEYQLTFEAHKYQPQVVENIRVDSAAVSYYLCALDQDRSDSMKVEGYFPIAEEGGTVSAASPIGFYFNFEVDTLSFREAFSITPGVEGHFEWEDQGRIARFIPAQPLEVSTSYYVFLEKSVSHIGGLPMRDDFSFSFYTDPRNRLNILNLYPGDGLDDVYPFTQVRLHFDGRIRNEDLGARIRVVDGSGKEMARSGVEINAFPGNVGSYAFSPPGLQPGSLYTLMIDSRLSDIEGLSMGRDLNITFRVKAVDHPEGEMIFDFEDSATGWSIDPLRSRGYLPGTANRMLRYSGSKLFGSYSYRLLYGFGEEDAAIAFRPALPVGSFRNGDRAGIYIWGDLSENRLFMLFQRGEEIREVLLTPVNFAGWQFREVTLELPEEEWEFAGFLLESEGTPFSGGGALYFDDLVKISSPVGAVEMRMGMIPGEWSFYPNPTRDKLYVRPPLGGNSLNQDRLTYFISDLSGRILLQGNSFLGGDHFEIPLFGLNSGSYQVRIELSGETAAGLFIVN